MAKSRKASSRRERSHRCKYGKLKHAVKTPSGGKRLCKKRRSQKYGGNKGDESKSHRDFAKSHRHRSGKGLTLVELKKIAKAHGIKRFSSLKRASLKAKLTRAGIRSHMSHHKDHKDHKDHKHSRKHSKKKSRSRRRKSCKYGKLKHAVKTPSGGMRRCKKRRSQKYGGNKGDESKSHRDFAKSRKRRSTKKKSRSRRCKYGKLKHAVKTPSGGKRRCQKSHGPHRKSKKKSRSRKYSKKKSHSRRRRSCKFGKLKHPIKTASGGMRRCKKRRSQKYGGNKGDESKSRRDYRR